MCVRVRALTTGCLLRPANAASLRPKITLTECKHNGLVQSFTRPSSTNFPLFVVREKSGPKETTLAIVKPYRSFTTHPSNVRSRLSTWELGKG